MHRVALLADVDGPLYHVGDEAMFAATAALLRAHAPELELTTLGRASSHDEIAAAVWGAHAAVVCGGGNLSDSWPELVDQRLALLEAAQRAGVPTIVSGQTFGPNLSGERRDRLAQALRQAVLVGAREQPSAALARALGVADDRLLMQPDDAACIDEQPPPGPVAELLRGPYLAVSLDGSFDTDAADLTLTRLASQLAVIAADIGAALVVVPHEGVLGEAAGPDADAGRRLAVRLHRLGRPCEILPVLPAEQAAWVARRATLTVSSRYHPVVFATTAGRPAIGLARDAYTRVKLEGALAHAGRPERCLDLDDAERGGLLAAARGLAGLAVDTAAAARVEAADAHRRRQFLAALGISAQPADTDSTRGTLASAAPPTMSGVSASPDTEQHVGTVGPHPTEVSHDLSLEQWAGFARDGFLHLGQVLDAETVQRLKTRADDLALGRLTNDQVQMQLDTGGAYESLPEAVDTFGEGTLLYRKIQGLEFDDEFIDLVRHPRFFEVCAHMYGPHVPISIFRAMIMNKPAGQGTVLPWHQDGGDVWALDREPLVTIWVALDDATTANGCMEAVRGSHRLGLLTSFGSTLSDEHAAAHCPPEQTVALEVPAGHAVLMHNWLIHRSGVNPSPNPRRAVTICYVDGRTRRVQTGDLLPGVAGHVDDRPHPYVAAMQDQLQDLYESRDESTAYAASLREALASSEAHVASLQETLEAVQASQREAERYALSLAAERERLEAALRGEPAA